MNLCVLPWERPCAIPLRKTLLLVLLLSLGKLNPTAISGDGCDVVIWWWYCWIGNPGSTESCVDSAGRSIGGCDYGSNQFEDIMACLPNSSLDEICNNTMELTKDLVHSNLSLQFTQPCKALGYLGKLLPEDFFNQLRNL